MRERERQERLVRFSTRRNHAAVVERRSAARAQKIVDQRIARTRVAGERRGPVREIGDIGDAADIDDDERPRPIGRRGQGVMEDRYERRPLPARGDVGGAEVIDDRDCETRSERAAIADLHRQSLRRPMQHRLAVKADDVDVARRQCVLGQKCRDRRGMRIRHEPLGVGENARARGTIGKRLRRTQRVAQKRALGLRIRPVAGRAQTMQALAVGIDERDVDAIE